MPGSTGRLVRWVLVLSVAAAVLVAVLRSAPDDQAGSSAAGNGADNRTQQTDFGPLGPADRDLLAKVRQAGLWEAPTGQQMQQRASSGLVREVGGLLATEHAELDEIVRDAADRLGVDLPSQPSEQQQSWMADISAQSGPEYDRVAINLLRAAHGKVLPVIAQVRSGTRNDLIREFAESATEFVTRHHQYLESTGLVDFAALPEPAGSEPAGSGPAAPGPAAPAVAAPAPVANAVRTEDAVARAAAASYPVQASTLVSAVVAVLFVLGAGGLIGMMMHAGSRRRGRGRWGTPERGFHRPPPGQPYPAPEWRRPPQRPPGVPPHQPRRGPVGHPARRSGPPGGPPGRGATRAQAVVALLIAAGLVGTLVISGRGAPQPAAAAYGTGHGHRHGAGVANIAAARPAEGADSPERDDGGGNRGAESANGLDIVGRDCANSDLQPHDGFQDGPRCVNTAAGEVSAAEDNPSLLIAAAPQRVRVGEPFTMQVSTRNLVRDRFLAAADGGYYLERSELTEQGLQRGHFHTACRMLRNNAAPDPAPEPAAFVATEDGGGGARPDVVTVEIPGLPQRGVAQCASWAGDGSHRTPMMERANQTPAFDAVRVVVE